MAHELATTADGRKAMAYVGEKPWHNLGEELPVGSGFDVWLKAAGMDFAINSAPVQFAVPGSDVQQYTGKVVLHRSDNSTPLAIVSDRYKVVQPVEVLEFFRDMTEKHGWELETAGVLFAGQKYWALAKTGNEARIKGQDVLKDYMLLATSCDGSLRTMAKRTSVRVVCNNTLSYAAAVKEPEIRVSHATKFDANAVKLELGLIDPAQTWNTYIDQVNAMAGRRISNKEAVEYLLKMFGDDSKTIEQQTSSKTIAKIMNLFDGNARGAELTSANKTAWGLYNSVSEYLLYVKGSSPERRVNDVWFGGGDKTNTEAFNEAFKLAA